MGKLFAVFDADWVAYEAACLAEKRSIVVTHKNTGESWEFKTRTEFWGTKRSKDGAFLKQLNENRDSIYTWDEFEITDIQTPSAGGMGHAVNVVKARYESILGKLGLTYKDHFGFVGKGDSWRVEASTLIKYKDNRNNLIRPLLLTDIKDFLVEKMNCEYSDQESKWESDDHTVAECFRNPNRVLVHIEKDQQGSPVIGFNPDRMDEPLNYDCFGKLWIDDKNKVRGYGRKWYYFQVLSGDSSDNYFANCMSDKKWAACPS